MSSENTQISNTFHEVNNNILDVFNENDSTPINSLAIDGKDISNIIKKLPRFKDNLTYIKENLNNIKDETILVTLLYLFSAISTFDEVLKRK